MDDPIRNALVSAAFAKAGLTEIGPNFVLFLFVILCPPLWLGRGNQLY